MDPDTGQSVCNKSWLTVAVPDLRELPRGSSLLVTTSSPLHRVLKPGQQVQAAHGTQASLRSLTSSGQSSMRRNRENSCLQATNLRDSFQGTICVQCDVLAPSPRHAGEEWVPTVLSLPFAPPLPGGCWRLNSHLDSTGWSFLKTRVFYTDPTMEPPGWLPSMSSPGSRRGRAGLPQQRIGTGHWKGARAGSTPPWVTCPSEVTARLTSGQQVNT